MTKKIAFADMGRFSSPDRCSILDYIKEVCDVEVVDMAHANYVIYSVMGDSHWQAPDRCVKIFLTIEDLAPDFNACDYAIGFEWMKCEDRYIRFPLYYRYYDICELMESKHLLPFANVRAEKTAFCSITVSNSNRHPMFKELFEELSKYKKVDSGGKWNNNVGGPVADKLVFDRSHKFSIVCENTAHSGYTTEKLVQAFAAGCIPIYWGDPNVTKVFNPKAFIRVQDFSSLQEALAFVMKVDADDQLWESMMREPVLTNSCYSKVHQEEQLKHFLSNIFNQPLEDAYRRNRLMWGKMYIDDRRRQTKGLAYVIHKKYHLWIWKAKSWLKNYL